jgi:hypothetical protein
MTLIVTPMVSGETYMTWAELPEMPMATEIVAGRIKARMILFAYQGRIGTA